MFPLYLLFPMLLHKRSILITFMFYIAAHLCGSKKEFVLISSGAYLTMHFKTDESVGERGFKLILEDMIQKQSQKSNIDTKLPINGK